tara:strand:+ start:763 stop:1278 length:516 start_codon:yes stop_codon:yes gene_type:complete
MALTKLNFSGSGQGSIATQVSSSLPNGSVVQVVGTTNDTDVNRVGNTTMTDSISQVITPSSASNKIVVIGNHHYTCYAQTYNQMKIRLIRTVGGSDTSILGDNYAFAMHGSGSYYPYDLGGYPMNILDDPQTTSQITYHIQFAQHGASGYNYHLHANHLGASSLILMEIKG